MFLPVHPFWKLKSQLLISCHPARCGYCTPSPLCHLPQNKFGSSQMSLSSGHYCQRRKSLPEYVWSVIIWGQRLKILMSLNSRNTPESSFLRDSQIRLRQLKSLKQKCKRCPKARDSQEALHFILNRLHNSRLYYFTTI